MESLRGCSRENGSDLLADWSNELQEQQYKLLQLQRKSLKQVQIEQVSS